MPHRPIRFLPLLLALLAILPGRAFADVHRCVGQDGRATYTDKRCRDIGAEEAPRAPTGTGAVAQGTPAARCPRSVQDLIYDLGSAIDRRDTNRLAALYHWPGMSSDQAYRIMERLAAIAERPLVDISPVFPSPAEDTDGGLYPQATANQAPIGLRVEQTLANGSTPSRTHFGLRRHLGCLWITF